jgi:hypothetical protein
MTTASRSVIHTCQGTLNRKSRWYRDVVNMLELLILLFARVDSSEIVVSGVCSLTGIEREVAYEGR